MAILPKIPDTLTEADIDSYATEISKSLIASVQEDLLSLITAEYASHIRKYVSVAVAMKDCKYALGTAVSVNLPDFTTGERVKTKGVVVGHSITEGNTQSEYYRIFVSSKNQTAVAHEEDLAPFDASSQNKRWRCLPWVSKILITLDADTTIRLPVTY